MCGFVGMTGSSEVSREIGAALQAIQHRGQDSAGIGTVDRGRFHLHKGLGLVSQVLPDQALDALAGCTGVGHVRYPTVGNGVASDAQPFLSPLPGVVMAHNGNVVNMEALRLELRERGLHQLSNCDVETILLVLCDELLQLRRSGYSTDDLVQATRGVMKRVRGSYSCVAAMEVDGRESLVAFRDPHGIRPLVMGQRADGAWMVSSESVALDVSDFVRVESIPGGTLAVFRPGEAPVVREVAPAAPKPCVFEKIYFARADSWTDAGRVNTLRWELGLRLAAEWQRKGHQADLTVAIPDTSRPAAMAMAEALGIPNREGFIKNRYSGRTFIMPTQSSRDAALRLKLNPIREIFEGKRVIVVDDSIVRGSTMRRIVRMLRTLRPAALHVAIFSPPVRHPCFYGIDMPSEQELVAASLDPASVEAALAKRFEVDSLTFLSPPALDEVFGTDVCNACFTGLYPVPVDAAERGVIEADRRPGKA